MHEKVKKFLFFFVKSRGLNLNDNHLQVISLAMRMPTSVRILNKTYDITFYCPSGKRLQESALLNGTNMDSKRMLLKSTASAST